MNLVELGKEAVKEDDRAALLEDGFKAASPKLHSSSVTSLLLRFLCFDNLSFSKALSLSDYSNLFCLTVFWSIRFFLMDESFLIENRLTLRAM